MTDRPLLDVRDLRVAYTTRAGEATVIPGVSFQLRAGEALGLVGESGCGKSTVALSIVRYLGRAGRIVGGRVRFEGRELTALDDAGLRAIRGRRIAMVYQDPMASLNPVMTVGRQLMEAPMTHEGVSASAARARALAMLAEVKLADPEAVMARFPHQLSGGQQQRIVIAMALITGPALLIMDEPTTGLDVTVEAAVLDLVRELRSRHRSAILFISHNLGSVVRVCDRVAVMYRGEVVEEGPVRRIFGEPRRRRFRGPRGPVRAVSDVNFAAARGRTLAIVGESGCGKSTIAKVLSGLEVATAGTVMLDGVEVGTLAVDARAAALKRTLQMVFQNPDSTLNPSHTVGYAIGRALRRLQRRASTDPMAGVARLLEVVKLPPSIAARKPRHLSGGEKQRAAIARALAGDPEVIVADEPVSALDVSVQAAIVNLLTEIQAARGATLVFISHDLAVVRYLADTVAVMYLGTVAEVGPVERVFAPPYHPYTEALLSAVPVPDPDHAGARILLEGRVPGAGEIPRGCPFATRCPRRVGPLCDETPPPVQRFGDHRIACHIPGDELARLQTALVEPRSIGR